MPVVQARWQRSVSHPKKIVAQIISVKKNNGPTEEIKAESDVWTFDMKVEHGDEIEMTVQAVTADGVRTLPTEKVKVKACAAGEVCPPTKLELEVIDE